MMTATCLTMLKKLVGYSLCQHHFSTGTFIGGKLTWMHTQKFDWTQHSRIWEEFLDDGDCTEYTSTHFVKQLVKNMGQSEMQTNCRKRNTENSRFYGFQHVYINPTSSCCAQWWLQVRYEHQVYFGWDYVQLELPRMLLRRWWTQWCLEV